ncbi:MAG TPA: radical SAM protein, partial [Bacteroidales bacterium]|nr:radical SAM protein [Bacteroidales bacterium]
KTMKLSGITFLPTYNCNASCSHCFFDTKACKQYMEPDIVHKVFENYKITKFMTWVHVSGGEILLNQRACFDLIETIQLYFKKNIGISTNAFWATSSSVAYDVVQTLVSLGVNGIAVSADYFHSPYVPLSHIKRAVQAIVDSGITTHCYIMGAQCKSDVLNSNDINSVSQQIAAYVKGNTNMPLAPTNIRSIGYGSKINSPKKQIVPNGKCTDLSECLGKRGPLNPKMVWIDCYGNVMICYGIIIGNIYKTSFAEIIANYSPKQSIIIDILTEKGPIGLYELAQQMNVAVVKEFYDECDVCYSSRKALQPFFSELGPAECYPY